MSRLAFGWAMREAELRHAPLTVITVYPVAVRPATEIYWAVPNYPEEGYDAEHARKAVREFVDKVAGEIGATVPEVTVTVVTGDAAAELVRASRDADLLVLGSRGTGGFAKLLMGSVRSKVTTTRPAPWW